MSQNTVEKTNITITIPHRSAGFGYQSYVLSPEFEIIGTVEFSPAARYFELVKEHDEAGLHDEDQIRVFRKAATIEGGTLEYFFEHFDVLGEKFKVFPHNSSLPEGDETDYVIEGFHNEIKEINGKVFDVIHTDELRAMVGIPWELEAFQEKIAALPKNLLVELIDFTNDVIPVFNGSERERDAIHASTPFTWDLETGRIYCTPAYLYDSFFEQGYADPQDFWAELSTLRINDFAETLQKMRS